MNCGQIPTVGFNMRKISKGNVTIKLWDIGGQPRSSIIIGDAADATSQISYYCY